MKKQQKKAFTLVELLVVIAILAILSTVAVVGYTSFIKKADISNDQTVAEQLNRRLEAMKADVSSPYYGQEIHAGNIREITRYILDDAGMAKLEPKAEKYGYDFYFNLETGVYESVDPVTAGRSDKALEGLLGYYGKAAGVGDYADSDYEVRLENSFTTDNKYFLVSTTSEVAELITEIYGRTVSGSAAVQQLIDDLQDTVLKDFINSAVIVTDGMNYRSNETVPTTVFFTNGVNHLTVKTDTKVDGSWGNLSTKDVIADTLHVTVPNTVTAYDADSLNFVNSDATVYSDMTSDELALKAIAGITNATLNLTDGEFKTDGTVIKNESTEKQFNYDNKIDKVDVVRGESAEADLKNPVGVLLNGNASLSKDTIVVPAEVSNFKILLSFTGGDDSKPVLGRNIVDLAITPYVGENPVDKGSIFETAEYVVDGEYINVVFKGNERPTKIDIVATTDAGLQVILFVQVETITSATVKLGDADTLDVYAPINVELVSMDGNPVESALELSSVVTLLGNSGICAQNIYCNYESKSGSATVNYADGKLTTSGTGSGVLTVTVGTENYAYLTYKANLTIANAKDFAVQPVHENNFTALGNQNAVSLASLFTLNGVTTLPEGAKLLIHNGQTMADNTYMNPKRGVVYTEDIGGKTLSEVSIDWTKVDASAEDTVYILVVDKDGVRISVDVEVLIVDALNVTKYDDFALNDSKAFTKSIVLLSDIAMPSDGYMTIGKNLALYGNGYTLDVTAGRREDGIITLAGTLRDIKIIGEVYPDFVFSRGDEYGSSAVVANNGAYIYNSYISNTRAPLMVNSGTIVIEDSVLFGGRYANVDAVGGTLTIRGTVTTVQQVVEANDKNKTKVIGLGISAWFNDSKKTVLIEDGANLVQYNFIDQSIKDHLPTLDVVSGVSIMDMKEPFEAMFGSATYKSYMFTANNGNLYANSGIISTDKYSLDYKVEGKATGSWGSKYKVGDIKTVTVETAVGDDEEFTIAYDTRFTPKVGTVISAGYVKVTGAQLKAGVQFEVNTEISAGVAGLSDPTPYLFQIQSDDYLTINVLGGAYNNLTYNFDKDMSSTMGSSLVSAVISMHDKGVHYGKMCAGVNTPDPDAIAYGKTTYQHVLEQYITMGNFYAPGTYQFVNGHIVNYSK